MEILCRSGSRRTGGALVPRLLACYNGEVEHLIVSGHVSMPHLLIGSSSSRASCPSSPAQTLQCRWRHGGKNRFNLIRKRAVEQHADYVKQLKPPTPYRKVTVDSALETQGEFTRRNFLYPDVVAQPVPEQDRLMPEVALAPRFPVDPLGRLDVQHFGRLEVRHGDLYEMKNLGHFKADDQDVAVILPAGPDLTPYRGLSLEVMERGGPELVQDLYKKAQGVWEARVEDSLASRDEKQTMARGLLPGDTLWLQGRYHEVPCQQLLFVVLPWFWQGSPLDAAKRFRYCVQQAFAAAASQRVGKVMLPNLGCGVYGYEPHRSSQILVEEAFDALLQLEATTPTYNLKEVVFVDSRRETAEDLSEALTEVGHRWLPERKIATPAEFWGHSTRRLMVLPAVPNFFLKGNRVKFRQRHGVKKSERRHHIGNIRPNVWRSRPMHQPPPLLVYRASVPSGHDQRPRSSVLRKTGKGGFPAVDTNDLEKLFPARLQVVGDERTNYREERGDGNEPQLGEKRQLKGRPFYFRGLSHWLFPARKSGFPLMRRGTHGKWVGKNVHDQPAPGFRPRL